MAAHDIMQALRRFDFAALYNTFLSLPPKQQTVTLGVSGVLAFFVTVVPLVFVLSHLGGLEDAISSTREKIDKAVTDIQAYKTMEKKSGAIERKFNKQTRDSLLTVVKRLAEKHDLRAEDSAGRGSENFEIYEEEKVKFHIKQVELGQLVKFLHDLESTEQRIIRVKKMKVTPVYGNRGLLNADFSEVAAYKLLADTK